MVKKYIKNSLLILCAFIIIAFSFIMPKLLLQLEDLSREKEIFARMKKESKIDVQAEKIYLVRCIHDLYEFKSEKVYYGDGKTVAVSLPRSQKTKNTDPTIEVKNEISKLTNINIIKDVNIENFIIYEENTNIYTSEYVVIESRLSTENEELLELGIEEKTGKIISLVISNIFFREDVDAEEIMKNYIKYLDLDIIDDWKRDYNDQYMGDALKSEKAQLVIILEKEDDRYMITVVPTEMYKERIEYEYIKNKQYVISEKKNK